VLFTTPAKDSSVGSAGNEQIPRISVRPQKEGAGKIRRGGVNLVREPDQRGFVAWQVKGNIGCLNRAKPRLAGT